jgi:putative transcriptional regulator
MEDEREAEASSSRRAPAPLDGGKLERAQRERLIRKTRADLGLSEAAFAARFHVPIETLLEWEQGQTPVPDYALAYFQVIAVHPDLVGRILDGRG